MAEQKSKEELATELTIEYYKHNIGSTPEQVSEIWIKFWKTIQFKGEEKN